MRLDGAVALVTGGASGLGKATVTRLVADGAKAVIIDLESSPGVQVASELGDAVRFVPTDVTDPEGVAAAVAVGKELGDIRIAVNCAGLGTPGKTLGKQGPMPLEQFTRIVTVNLIGTFNVARLAAEAMSTNEPIDGDRGVIVNTASAAAFDGQIGQVSYSASKGGVVGMTLPMARELASFGVRVMTIAPGLFKTPMLAGLPQEAQDSLGAQVPHPSRLGDPSEYASLVRHIVDNPMMNGEVIRLDGAIRMAPK